MKIAILGAGVAGIGCAIALKQAGFDVSVHERHASATNIGAGVVIWPNAACVLDQLGVLRAVEAVSGRPSAMRRRTRADEDLGAIDIGRINHRMGYSSLSVLRSDLMDILLSRLAALGVEVRYAHAVTGIEHGPAGRARVRFRDGTEMTPDAVVGADGRMASHARRYVHGSNAPIYQGFINWVGVCASEKVSFDDMAVTDYWGVGERFGIVPITGHMAYWAAGTACAEIGSNDPSAYRAELRALFSTWPMAVRSVIEHTPHARINKIYVHDHDPIRRWHRDNVIVVGDAAHAPLPTSGQGACQALEDAWHLARCLEAAPRDMQQAFARFTQQRFEKTANIIMAGRGLAASLFHRDEDFCRARNEDSKATDFAGLASAMARGWAQGLPLRNQVQERA